MRRQMALLVLVCTVVLVPVLSAQPRGPGAGARHEEVQARREEAFKMIDAYLVANLPESLGLSDEQFVKVLPHVRKVLSSRREYFLSRARLMRELRHLLHAGGASESEVVERLKALKAAEEEWPARARQEMAALDAVLTPLQQAKYRLLEGEVEQRMRELSRQRPQAGQRRSRE